MMDIDIGADVCPAEKVASSAAARAGSRRRARGSHGTGGPGRRTRRRRPAGPAARRRSARPRARKRCSRSTRSSVLAPYPNAARQRRCSCRSDSPVHAPARRPDGPAAQPAGDREGDGIGARPVGEPAPDRALQHGDPIRCAPTRRSSRPASGQSSASGTRWSRNSAAGSPSTAGAAPGRNRTAAISTPGPSSLRVATESGPATTSSRRPTSGRGSRRAAPSHCRGSSASRSRRRGRRDPPAPAAPRTRPCPASCPAHRQSGPRGGG